MMNSQKNRVGLLMDTVAPYQDASLGGVWAHFSFSEAILCRDRWILTMQAFISCLNGDISEGPSCFQAYYTSAEKLCFCQFCSPYHDLLLAPKLPADRYLSQNLFPAVSALGQQSFTVHLSVSHLYIMHKHIGLEDESLMWHTRN